VALGGHALIIFAALLLSTRAREVAIAPGVVGVTLVDRASAEAAASPAAARSGASADFSSVVEAVAPDASTGESLDRLISPGAPSAPPAGASRHLAGAPPGASGAAASNAGASGSSQADQGLGQGEGAEGIDLYAAASLPNVGMRPASPPAGDLWNRVAPCWRSASPRKAILMVEIGADGGLSGSPRAVRKISVSADPQLLLAERAGLRALQACSPYSGLGGRTWRVTFP
jgi:hypothetical protein